MQRTPNKRGPLFLGGNAHTSSICSVCQLGNWLVQSLRPGCRHHRYKVQLTHLSLVKYTDVLSFPESFACATFISTIATFDTSYVPSASKTIGIYAAVLCAQGMVNTFGVHLLKHINTIAVYWNALGTSAVAIAVLASAPSHQSAKFVFTGFVDDTGVTQPDGSSVGWSTRASPAYVAIIGILIAQYSLTGFDASAHVCDPPLGSSQAESL